jgi:hypothetical protein
MELNKLVKDPPLLSVLTATAILVELVVMRAVAPLLVTEIQGTCDWILVLGALMVKVFPDRMAETPVPAVIFVIKSPGTNPLMDETRRG